MRYTGSADRLRFVGCFMDHCIYPINLRNFQTRVDFVSCGLTAEDGTAYNLVEPSKLYIYDTGDPDVEVCFTNCTINGATGNAIFTGSTLRFEECRIYDFGTDSTSVNIRNGIQLIADNVSLFVNNTTIDASAGSNTRCIADNGHTGSYLAVTGGSKLVGATTEIIRWNGGVDNREVISPDSILVGKDATINSRGSISFFSHKPEYQSISMPTQGAYTLGTYVKNDTPSVIQDSSGDNYIVKGWIRLTTGSTHVAGVDWLADTVSIKNVENYILPEMFGAKGDGVTDDLVALKAADAASVTTGLPVQLGARTYAIGGVFEFSGKTYIGVENKSRILALSGWNDAVVKSKGAPAGDYLTLNSSTGMVDNITLRNIIIEGGWGGPDDTTRTHTEALRIYGAGTKLEGIRCGYVSGVGFNLGGRGHTTVRYGAPSRYVDLRADFVGEHGIVVGGSSDNHSSQFIVRNCGLKTNNTYDGIRFGGGGGTRADQFHVWQSGDSQITPYYTNRVRYGLYLASFDTLITNCHFEGCSSAQIVFVGARNSVINTRCHSNWESGGSAVLMLADTNTFQGFIGAPANNVAATAVHAFTLGDVNNPVKNCRIDAYIYGCKFLNYSNSTGRNYIKINGDLSVSGATGFGTIVTGSIPDNEVLEINSPQYNGLQNGINLVVNGNKSITGYDITGQGSVVFNGLTTDVPTVSGRLYKDSQGFVKIKS